MIAVLSVLCQGRFIHAAFGNLVVNITKKETNSINPLLFSANDNSDGGLNKFDTDIVVEFNGKNTWLAPVIFKSTCKINVAYFPFDEQVCTVCFCC